MWPLDACVGRAEAGAKAATLARMRAAGLRVADGVVLPAGEAVEPAALAGALARLGGERFVVRSSAALEDRAGGSAAGVFVSVVAVRAEDVAQAVAEVRRSAEGAAVRAYLAARGIADADVGLAVLIQPWVEAERYGVAHSRADGFAVEERGPGEPEWGDVRAFAVVRDDDGELAAGMRALEGIVGGPVDAEWARRGAEVTWLQARPLTAAGTVPAETAEPLPEAGRWVRDAEHNPDPLSAAQASLVAFVETLGVGGRQRVVGGYLYVERGGTRRGLAPIEPAQLRRRFDENVAPDCARVLAAAEVEGTIDAALAAYAHVFRRYVGELSPSLSRARAELDQMLRVQLGESLAMHGELLGGLGGATLARDQALWELGRAASAERAGGDEKIAGGDAKIGGGDAKIAGGDEKIAGGDAKIGGGDAKVAGGDEKIAGGDAKVAGGDAKVAGDTRSDSECAVREADYVARYGDHAPAWDLAVATDRERPDRVRALAATWAASPASPLARHAAAEAAAVAASQALLARLDPAARPAFTALLATVREVLPIAEDDDLLFLRAQATVRRALLGRAATLDLAAPDDAFALTLDEARQPPPDLRARVAARQSALAAAARRLPPSAYHDGRPEWAAPPARTVLRGAATAGHARGRAVVVRALADAPTVLPPDAVLLVPALVPSLTPLLPQACALVTDHGGALSHAATLAREYGVPAVLGVGNATALADGTELYVDADAGRVYVLTGGDRAP